jgi:hypothetical protein
VKALGNLLHQGLNGRSAEGKILELLDKLLVRCRHLVNLEFRIRKPAL